VRQQGYWLMCLVFSVILFSFFVMDSVTISQLVIVYRPDHSEATSY
jgi:hypothetical protein